MKQFLNSQKIDLHEACRTGELAEIKAAFYADPEKVNQKDQRNQVANLRDLRLHQISYQKFNVIKTLSLHSNMKN